MKIAIDARFYGLENGGLGRYTLNLIEQITKLDNKNSYFVLLRDKYFEELTMPANFQIVKISSRHYSLKEQLEVLWALRRINPDITHFLHFNVPYFFQGKYVITIHDLLMHSGVGKEATTLPSWKYKIKRLGYRKVFDHAVLAASKIIVPSKFVKEEILTIYNLLPAKVSVIYEGVSQLSAAPRVATAASFLYVGNAYPHKNLKTLIQAIALLNKDRKYLVKLVLVTPRDVFTLRLNDTVEDAGVRGLVELKSGVSDLELSSLYKNSLAFVYPSFSEGFGLQGLEAMSVGTRLLASNIAVFREVYGDCADYFDPKDPSELVEVMEKVIKEKKLVREAKIKKAKQFVKRYSWEQMARATLALYEGE